MKLKTLIAVGLIGLGIAAFVYQVVTYARSREDPGVASVRPPVGRTEGVPLPSAFGTVALIAGIALLLVELRDFERVPAP